ncbi:hypothetical protein KFZ76_11805 [Methylovulum psychrotolerans]|uniref:hypothetical protein n=1 Tax=Methylovulum psychrotolerans TaxID=1704499 RepID=UPI001BFF6482|nr:hypothetical protein [Methylovulum psychrotolerans]MBT9098391.1 hypothetical protein [Methylovulum psychrotolerans]
MTVKYGLRLWGEQDARAAIIAETKTWLGTPWRHQAAVQGAGVDCGKILIEIYAACGLIERPTVESYPRQWALHRDEERYLLVVEQYCHRVDSPGPGDLAVWRFGRTFSHGAIVVDWPSIIHADVAEGVVWADASCGRLSEREQRFYSIFG